MPENRHLRRLVIILYIALGVLAAYLVVKYVLKWLLPFIIAFVVALILRRPTAFITKKLRLPRNFVSIAMVVLFYGVVGTGVGLLISYIISQIRAFASDMPGYLSSLPEVLDGFHANLQGIASRLPSAIGQPVLEFLNNIFSGSFSLPSMNVGSVFGTVKNVAFSIPAIIIFTVAMLVSTYYVLSDFARVTGFIAMQIPERARESLSRLKTHMFTTLGRWFRAMGIVICITFTELLIGFIILDLDYAALIAGLVAIIDALPVFGTGTVLIPWAIYLVLIGDFTRGLFIAGMYIVITIVRNIVEPRILGDHIGLNPLVMLICFYLGFVTLGIVGMFVLPITIISLDKLQEWGYIKLWKTASPTSIT
jgi:sporulation integral membrane protein YtvI